MKLQVQEITASEWATCSADAHLAVFNERLPPEYDRLDFALLVTDTEKDVAAGYVTCRELSPDDVYLRRGGAFPPIAGSIYSLAAYKACLQHLRARYQRITTLVENTNTVYLKMALTVGFLPIGIRNFKGSILLELLLAKDS